MTLLTVQTILDTGTIAAPQAVSATDTINVDSLGPNGFLEIINAGGSTDNVTIVDSGLTPAGNLGIADVVAVAAGATKKIRIRRELADSGAIVTINNSFTTSVTCNLWKPA
jgi:hypothetical protein